MEADTHLRPVPVRPFVASDRPLRRDRSVSGLLRAREGRKDCVERHVHHAGAHFFEDTWGQPLVLVQERGELILRNLLKEAHHPPSFSHHDRHRAPQRDLAINSSR